MAATMLRSASRCRNFERLSHQMVQQVRHRSGLPLNTIILFVPQQESWIVERMGKFQRALEPGLNFLIPVLDTVRYVQSLKEIAIDIPKQSAITIDNVTLNLDGVLYLKVFDPYKASYGVEDAEYAISQLAQTTLRSEIGKILLDTVFRERDSLNVAIVEAINKAAESWGIRCMRYEIRDIKLPSRVQEAMQMQVEAERKKRASILESEGIRESEINVAEGKKQSKILASEAWKMEQVNTASGEADALMKVASARAEAIVKIAEAIGRENGQNAVSLRVAEQYIQAFGNIAKEGNTILLPSNTGDVSSMVSQAMAIFNTVKTNIPTIPSDKKELTSSFSTKPYAHSSVLENERTNKTVHDDNE
ncbi:stomatin-like protein stl-1 [Lineus longissimus]|uniref:stomatin-like protein stl-1 n=1 Tax=Lineus longissimus TaxID=88925 RepID=UPI00315CD1AD